MSLFLPIVTFTQVTKGEIAMSYIGDDIGVTGLEIYGLKIIFKRFYSLSCISVEYTSGFVGFGQIGINGQCFLN